MMMMMMMIINKYINELSSLRQKLWFRKRPRDNAMMQTTLPWLPLLQSRPRRHRRQQRRRQRQYQEQQQQTIFLDGLQLHLLLYALALVLVTSSSCWNMQKVEAWTAITAITAPCSCCSSACRLNQKYGNMLYRHTYSYSYSYSTSSAATILDTRRTTTSFLRNVALSLSITTSEDEQEEIRIEKSAQGQQQQQQQTAASSSSEAASSTAAMAQQQQQQQQQFFHQDMHRVVQSRQHILAETYPNRFQERKQRPIILPANFDDGAERCLTMLRRLQQMQQQQQQSNTNNYNNNTTAAAAAAACDETSFQITMQAFLHRGRLRWMKQQKVASNSKTSSNNDNNNNNNNTTSVVAVVICAADQLEELLHELWQIKPPQDVSLETYNLVLEAYANCATPRGNRNYAGRARALLEQQQQQHCIRQQDNNNNNSESNIQQQQQQQQQQFLQVQALMHVLRAYAWQQANLRPDDDCASQAQSLLEQIIQILSPQHDPKILLQCSNWVLEAWSKSGAVGSAQKANALFEQIKALNATLTTMTTTTITTTCTNDAAAITAGQILDAETYCNCALAWAKTTDAHGAEKAHEILLDMIEKYNQGAFPAGSEPSLIAFNGVMSAWARKGRADKAEEVLFLMEKLRPFCQNLVPDAMSYNSVLYAHAKSPNKEVALQKALTLVQYMKDNSEEQPAIKPNSFTYNTLMKCWIQSGRDDLAEQAEQTLIQMERLWEQGDYSIKPNNRIFNMVINAYAKSNDWNAARKAYRILERMKSLKDACRPDVISYTSVMECFSKSNDPDAPQKAEELLQEAFERYHKTKNPKDRPNLRTFTMAILTLAKSHGSVVRARALLTQLLELYQETQSPDLMPNEFPYNYVLNCAANTLHDNEKLEAFQIATRTYQEMRKSPYVKPDSFTYAFWLKCCNNLLPPGDLRQRCVSYAFEECKKEGLVSNEVLTRLYQGNSPLLVKELLQQQQPRRPSSSSFRSAYRSLKIQDLPPSWSRQTVLRSEKR